MRAWVAWVAVAATLACAAPCIAAPTAVHGWPVRAPAGSVHQGPGGGAVVVNRGPPGRVRVHGLGVPARRPAPVGQPAARGLRQLRRRARSRPGARPTAPTASSASTGDDYWSVNQAGRRVRGCAGAVLPDGTCIATQFRLAGPAFDPENSLVARRGARCSGASSSPTSTGYRSSSVAPFAVRDGVGQPSTPPTGRAVPDARLVVVDGMTGGAARPRARLASSFVGGDGRLGAGPGCADAGGDRARRVPGAGPPWPAGGAFIDPQNVIVDRARGRVYVGRAGVDRRWTTTAFAAATGAVLWRSARGAERAAALAGPGRAAPGRGPSVRRPARSSRLGLDGRTRWTFRTASDVVGARELTGRTVVVSTDRSDGTRAALAHRPAAPLRVSPPARRGGARP